MKKVIFIIILLMSLTARADYLGSWAIDDYVTITANLHSAATGAETAADGDVDIWIYEDDSATQIYDDTMAAFDSITGLYLEKVQLLTATGFEAGKHYTVLIRATVGGIAGHTTHNFQILSQVDAVQVNSATPMTLADIQAGNIVVSTTIATVTTPDTVFTLTSSEGTIDDIGNNCTIVVVDDDNSSRFFSMPISDYTASTKTVTLASDPTPGAWTLDAGDYVYIKTDKSASVDSAAIADAVLDEAVSDHIGTVGILGWYIRKIYTLLGN